MTDNPYEADLEEVLATMSPAEQTSFAYLVGYTERFCGVPLDGAEVTGKFLTRDEKNLPSQICGVAKSEHDSFVDGEHNFESIADYLENAREAIFRTISRSN